jgi:hypothetical protein
MAINTQVHTTAAQATGRRYFDAAGASHRKNVTLWTLQIAFAGLFLFAGAGKLLGSAASLDEASPFPVLFLRFIGACELLGAIGLIAPWALRIKPGLTPLAAAGLAVIMVGATVSVAALTDTPAFALVNVAITAGLVAIVAGRGNYATRRR